jgi:hypothetical protein
MYGNFPFSLLMWKLADRLIPSLYKSLEEIVAVFGDNSFDLAILIVFFNIILVLA